MKRKLQKKLYGIIITVMMCSVSVDAQIVYTDIVPDSAYTLTRWGTHTFNLDLNGDSTTDFLIKVSAPRPRYPESPSSRSVSITPQENNAFITRPANTVKKLVPGDVIGSSQSWHNTTFQYLRFNQTAFSFPPVITNTGEWDNVVDGFVGLRLISGGQTYYGWVRMDVSVGTSGASMTIKDYAYNSIPNQPILAGEAMTTGIIENAFTYSINLFPNPASNGFTIDLGSNHEEVKVTVADMNGKVVYTTMATDTQNMGVNTDDFAEGIYVVQIQAGEFLGTKKLVVEK